MCAIHPTQLITLIHLAGTTNYKTPHHAVFSKVLYFLPHRSSTLLGTLFQIPSVYVPLPLYFTPMQNKRNVQHHVLLQHILYI